MPIQDKEDIARNIDELTEAVNDASLNYDIWWVYNAIGSRERYIDALRKYPLFFQASIDAHFIALLVALYRIFETRRDTINVSGLITMVENAGALPVSERSELDKLHRAAKPLWRKVSIIRSEIFAHRTKGSTPEKSFARAGLSPNEIKNLIDLSKKIVNLLSQAFDRSTFAFNLSAEADTRRLLEALLKTAD